MTASEPVAPPALLVTGLSGNIGRHLAPHLEDFLLVGVDLFSPRLEHPRVEFHPLDLSQPDAPAALESLMREAQVRQVVHLAFVLDPAWTGAMSKERQWDINVRGTAHLLEAVERVNQPQRQVEHFLYLSSVTSYGPHLPKPVREDYPQKPHSYTYALHKKETEDLCRACLPRLNGCAMTIVRGHIFLGPGVDNFIVTALQGRANPHTRLGRWVRRRGWRLPLLLPHGGQYDGLYQFMHMEDAARLTAWLCRHPPGQGLTVLNAQGRGEPVTGKDVARAGGVPLWRLPGYRFVRFLYQLVWWIGLSAVPPESFPYFAGSYVMNTERLEQLLGGEYTRIVQHTAQEALESIAQR